MRSDSSVFVFPGQGSQWPGMAVGLLDNEVFAARMRECEDALAPYADWSLVDVLRDERALHRVDVVQPALFAVMVSLAEVWGAEGVRPAGRCRWPTARSSSPRGVARRPGWPGVVPWRRCRCLRTGCIRGWTTVW